MTLPLGGGAAVPSLTVVVPPVLLQAVRGVIGEGIQWIRRSVCFCKSAYFDGSELRELSLLGLGNVSSHSGFPESFLQVAFPNLGL